MSTMALPEKQIDDFLTKFNKSTEKPELYLSKQSGIAGNLKKSIKDLYDYCKTKDSEAVGDALPELIVDSFDDEQIWQEVELQNDPLIQNLVSDAAHLISSKSLSFHITSQTASKEKHYNKARTQSKNSQADIEYDDDDDDDESDEEVNDELLDADAGNEDEDDELENESDSDDMIEKIKRDHKLDDISDAESEDDLDFNFKLNDAADDEEEMDMDGDEEDEEQEEDEGFESSKSSADNIPKKVKRKTEVDDKFFKLADMEAFLDAEDAKEEKRLRQQRGEEAEDEDDDDEDEEDDIDVFADIPSDDEDDSTDLKYDDFFDPVESNSDTEPAKKKVRFQSDTGKVKDSKGNSGAKDLFASDSEGEDVQDILGSQKKSSFEKRQEKLKGRISELEAAALAEKPWQLHGEVQATARPENSLLQEDLDFEHTTKQAPDITEETTKKLEDVIIQRIKDKAWDDVERKVKPKEDVYEYKQRLVLDQEKSKQSLGQIYEQEYLKQAQKEEEEEVNPKHEEIRKSMQSLFEKLDALSNFHFTPKLAAPEVKIVNNMPSIAMEEVAPVSMSDATMLAPEEIKEKDKAELKGDTEKSTTDRKRERREKKGRQKARHQERERKQKLIEKTNPGLAEKYAKQKAMKDLEQQSKSGKAVSVIKEDMKTSKTGLTSSTNFFNQLQEEVTSHIQSKKAQTKLKKKKREKSAATLKL